MRFWEDLLVDIVKTGVKSIAKKSLSEKTYQHTSTILTVIASILGIAMIGYFIFFLVAFWGYKGG